MIAWEESGDDNLRPGLLSQWLNFLHAEKLDPLSLISTALIYGSQLISDDQKKTGRSMPITVFFTAVGRSDRSRIFPHCLKKQKKDIADFVRFGSTVLPNLLRNRKPVSTRKIREQDSTNWRDIHYSYGHFAAQAYSEALGLLSKTGTGENISNFIDETQDVLTDLILKRHTGFTQHYNDRESCNIMIPGFEAAAACFNSGLTAARNRFCPEDVLLMSADMLRP